MSVVQTIGHEADNTRADKDPSALVLPSGAVLTVQPDDWTRTDWLAWRRQHIGASDIAGVIGWSRWASPMSVYLTKVGLLDDDDGGTDTMRLGQLLEPVIAALFTDRTGLDVVAEQTLVTHPEWPWLAATVDGLAVDTNGGWSTDAVLGVVECKNTADFSWSDGVPVEYELQVQTQLGLCGLDHGWLAVLHAGRRFAIYALEFDPAAWERIVRLTRRFWDRVERQDPPPPDAHDATTTALKDAWRDRADGTEVELDPDTIAAARAWQAAKARLADVQADVDELENRVRVALGVHEVGTVDGVPFVSWKVQRSAGRLDEQALRAAHPDLAAEFTKPATTVRVLRAGKALTSKEH